MATNVTDLDDSSSGSDPSGINSVNRFSTKWENLPSDVREIFRASAAGDVETLKSLLNNSSNPSHLLLQVDRYGHTALHQALNRDTAKVLVESVEIDKLKQFLWVSRYHCTALDGAAMSNKVDVVEYLCDLTSADESLLDGHLLPGHRPLHVAKSVRIARILVESVPSDKLTDLLLHTGSNQSTALHTAAREGCGEVVEYLCGLSTTQLSSADELLYMKNGRGRTALHQASTAEIATLLIDKVQDKWAYMCNTDNKGRTALHLSDTREVANLLIDTAQDKWTYINIPDKDGNTAVMYMIEIELAGVLKSTLDYIFSEFGVSGMKSALLITNYKKQNIFHLACISPLIEGWYVVLKEYLDCVKVEDLFTADIHNNTPFTYLVARYSTRLFAQFILKFPLWQRRILLLWRNQMQTNCRTVSMQKRFSRAFYTQRVLCSSDKKYYCAMFCEAFRFHETFDSFIYVDLKSPEHYTIYDEDLFKVMKYSLNEYSLLDQPIISTQSHVPALTSSVQRHGHEQTVEMDKNSVTAQSTLQFSFFDADKLAIDEIQRELYKLDVTEKQGQPKVVVVRYSTSDLVRYVSPPGPDFIIITLVSVHSASNMFSDLQTKSFGGIEQLLGYLKRQEIVKYININSTMARHYGSSSTEPADDHVLLSGASKGKALIICSRSGRDKWEIEHGHACRMMEQLGLQEKSWYDKSADDMLTAISEFSKSSGHGSLTALCIMSYGDLEGNIYGVDGRGRCSVQQVVDALCQPDIQSATKMIFLSYCRGPVGQPRSNRTMSSWETEALSDFLPCKPVLSDVDKNLLHSVRRSHPFPSADVPEDCYICYSTLPDSKSMRFDLQYELPNQMFVGLSEHLNTIYQSSSRYKTEATTPGIDISKDCVAVDTSPLEMDISTPEQVATTSTQQQQPQQQQQLPRVELISLLIDVTAIARERSGFTQYMNYCYAINKGFKPVALEIQGRDIRRRKSEMQEIEEGRKRQKLGVHEVASVTFH